MSVLFGCGGGGSGASGPIVTSFPLQSGYKARVASGSVTNYTISGTCSGSATVSVSAPTADTFEGAPALSATGTSTMNFANCTPSSIAATSTSYYDSNYNSLGHSTVGTEYGKFLTVPSPVPTSVKIGDTAVVGTETIYTDSTKTTTKGQRTRSYVIEADGASTSTAIVNLITRDFNTANQLLFTDQNRYRIVANGALTPVSEDVQYSTTSTTHLVLTAN